MREPAFLHRFPLPEVEDGIFGNFTNPRGTIHYLLFRREATKEELEKLKIDEPKEANESDAEWLAKRGERIVSLARGQTF